MPRKATVDRLVLTIQLLAKIPGCPVTSIGDLTYEMGIDERTMRRILRDLKEAGIRVEHETMRDGKRAYYIADQSKDFVAKILRVVKSKKKS